MASPHVNYMTYGVVSPAERGKSVTGKHNSLVPKFDFVHASYGSRVSRLELYFGDGFTSENQGDSGAWVLRGRQYN